MTDKDNRIDNRPMPLEGIRVLEYGVFHAGPGASAILGDLGAEVIKIEEGIGDPERYWTSAGGMDFSTAEGESFWYQMSNRSKKGIYLDIKKERGREILFRLVREADVFVTNLRKTTKPRLGIDYATMSRINPLLIHANVSGFGPEGPACDIGAFDPMGQGRSGMMYLTGNADPAIMNFGVLDQATAITTSHAIITALFVRERHGIGQEIHVSLYSTAVWLLYCNLMMMSGLGIDPNVEWSRSKNSPLRNRFCCKDEKWIIGTHHPEAKYWPAFCEIMGRPDLLDDPRFADDAGRMANCAELVSIFDEVFATKTRDEWVELFRERGLMFAPVQRINEVLTDPQALINGYVVDFDHPTLGRMKTPGYPAHFSAMRAGTQCHAPAIGEHTDIIMQQMGYSDQDIQDMKKDGVIR